MSKLSIFTVMIVIFSAAIGQASIEVISTTCQYMDFRGDVDWMTCPLKKWERETPSSFRQFKDDLASRSKDQKYCCGEITNRFCCSLEEKLRELPDFDPSQSNEVVFEDGGRWYENLGFWSWLFISSLAILMFGLIVYLASCIFVEILDMIMYVLCCCFCRSYRRREGYTRHDNTNRPRKPEYRPQQHQSKRPEQSHLVTVAPPTYVRNGNYQNGGYGTETSGGSATGTSALFQNVTPIAPPPAYNEKA